MSRPIQPGEATHPVSGSWTEWALRTLVALVFLAAAVAKLLGVPQLIKLFEKIGLGQWFRFFTAACEIGGAALLLIPRTATLGIALLGCVAAGALTTHIVVMKDNPADAIVLIVLLAAIAWLRGSVGRPTR